MNRINNAIAIYLCQTNVKERTNERKVEMKKKSQVSFFFLHWTNSQGDIKYSDQGDLRKDGNGVRLKRNIKSKVKCWKMCIGYLSLEIIYDNMK